MDLYEKIKELAAQKKISIRQLEEKLKLANGTIRRWGNTNPSTGAVAKVAKYFNVSVDYLLGLDDKEPELPNLSVEQILDSVENYSGGELTESDREMLRIIIEAKKAAVEKESKNKG